MTSYVGVVVERHCGLDPPPLEFQEVSFIRDVKLVSHVFVVTCKLVNCRPIDKTYQTTSGSFSVTELALVTRVLASFNCGELY